MDRMAIYGLDVAFVDDVHVEPPAIELPLVRVRQVLGTVAISPGSISVDEAESVVLGLNDGRATIRQGRPFEVEFEVEQRLSLDALVHPYLAVPAAVISH